MPIRTLLMLVGIGCDTVLGGSDSRSRRNRRCERLKSKTCMIKTTKCQQRKCVEHARLLVLRVRRIPTIFPAINDPGRNRKGPAFLLASPTTVSQPSRLYHCENRAGAEAPGARRA